MNITGIVKLEHMFKTLGNRKRLALLICLMKCEASINKLSVALSLPYKTVERNLINLVEAGFICKRTDSRQAFFFLNKNSSHFHSFVLKTIEEKCSGPDLGSLARSLLKAASELNKTHAMMWKQVSPKDYHLPLSRESGK